MDSCSFGDSGAFCSSSICSSVHPAQYLSVKLSGTPASTNILTVCATSNSLRTCASRHWDSTSTPSASSNMSCQDSPYTSCRSPTYSVNGPSSASYAAPDGATLSALTLRWPGSVALVNNLSISLSCSSL